MTKVELECRFCKCSFSTPLKRFNYLTKQGHKKFYCSKGCFVADTTSPMVERGCLFCKKTFFVSSRSDSRKCCSDMCSHKYAATFTNPLNVSVAAKNAWKRRTFTYKQKKCVVCGNQFEKRYTKCCSKKCARTRMSESGRISAELQKQNRSSKNEKMFGELCKSTYTNVLVNERMFNGWDADVILPDVKIAVLWNGNWHRYKITKAHSVEQVKQRDKIKLDEIAKMGYTAYIIEDKGKFNSQFVNDEFEKLKLFIDSIAVPSARICLS